LNAFIIGGLVLTLVFVARRLVTKRAENAQLQIHIVALKRQLARRDR